MLKQKISKNTQKVTKNNILFSIMLFETVVNGSFRSSSIAVIDSLNVFH